MAQIDTLLMDINNKEDAASNNFVSSSMDAEIQRFSSPFSSHNSRYRHYNSNLPNKSFRGYSRYQGDLSSNFNRFSPRKLYSPNTNNISSYNFIKCIACKAVGEPFIGHDIHNCPNVPVYD